MKYVGSKSSIIKYIAPEIHKRLSSGPYVEPFVGGGNAMSHITHPNRIGSDSNPYVIALLIALRDGWEPIDLDRDEYEHIRDRRDLYEPYLVGWAGVGCSYSGKWFGGYAGKVNTRGGVRDYIDEARRNCLKQAPGLRGVDFRHCEFSELDIPDDSVVYCDPPYANTLKYPGEFDTNKFWLWCQELSGFSTVLVSEYSAPAGWRSIWSGERGSSLSANGMVGGRQKSVEHLFIYEGQ